MAEDTDTDKEIEDLFFTEEGKLRHENKYLKERVANLETFKKNFFNLQNEIIEARETIDVLEQQLNMDRLKKRIIEHTQASDNVESVHAQNEEILKFFHDSISASSYQDLVMSMFQSVDGMGLDVAVQIRHKNNVINYALDEAHKEASISFINRHRDDGEIVEQESNILINHKYLSMLTGGAAVAEPEGRNHVRDFLEIIAVGANTRIDTLGKKLELAELRSNIYKIFRKTNQSFEAIQNNMDDQVIAISELFLGCDQQLRNTLTRSKLSEDHMKLINLIMADAKSELNLLLTSSLTMDENFVSVMKKLEKAYAPENQE